MGCVYSQASMVHCWLGKAEDGTRRAVKILKRMTRVKVEGMVIDGQPFDATKNLGTLAALLDRTYWTRAGVIQEVVLAKKAEFHCGKYISSCDHIPNLQQLRTQRKPYFSTHSSRLKMHSALRREPRTMRPALITSDLWEVRNRSLGYLLAPVFPGIGIAVDEYPA